MSLGVILKNIYSFLEVLQGANTADASEWNEESFNNARRWSAYCELIYKQAQGKPYQGELDSHIQRMGRLPWNIGGLQVNLLLLKDAAQHLETALEKNPALQKETDPTDRLWLAIDKPLPKKLADDIFMDIFPGELLVSMISQVAGSIRISLTKQKSKLVNTPPGEGKANWELPQWTKVQLSLIYQYLTKLRPKGHASYDQLDEILHSDGGPLVILTCLVPEWCLETKTSMADCPTDLLIAWISQLPSIKQSELWKEPIEMLLKVFEHHFDIYTIYVQYAVATVKNNPHQLHLTKREKVNLDEVAIEHQFSFLIEHGGSNVGKITEELVKSMATSMQSSMWTRLLT